MKQIISASLAALLLLGTASCKKENLTFVHPPVNLYGNISFADGTPAEGIVVTDGFTVTLTDSKGNYTIEKRGSNARYVYYSTPADVEIAFGDNGRPCFYKRISNDNQQYDFTITRQEKETSFRLLCIGDPQVCEANNGLARFEAETAPDIKALAESQNEMKTYSLSLGDHVHNEWSSFSAMFSLLDKSHLGIPNFLVIGNHDHQHLEEYKAIFDYEKLAGPVNFSFDRGDFHIVVLDNILYETKTFTETLSEDVMAWLKKDLSYVSTDKSLIIAYHASLSYDNFPEIYEIAANFKEARIVSGHAHSITNEIVEVKGKKVYRHICGTSNGVDWVGTCCGDGAPNGYAVFEMKGDHVYNHYYKPTKMSADFQIRMYHSESFPKFSHYTGSGDTTFDWNRTPGATIFNIWNYCSNWKLSVYENGVLSSKQPILDNSMYDMWYCTYCYAEKNRATGSYCQRRNHLFYYVPQTEGATIKIVAEDEYGNKYEQSEYTTTTKSAGSYE